MMAMEFVHGSLLVLVVVVIVWVIMMAFTEVEVVVAVEMVTMYINKMMAMMA